MAAPGIAVITSPVDDRLQLLRRFDAPLSRFRPAHRSVYFRNGWWFYIYLAYSDLLYLSSAFLLVANMRSSPPLYARQTSFALSSLVLLLLVEVGYQAGWVSFQGQNPVPAVMGIAVFLLALAVFRFGMLDITPIAQSTIFANLSDPLLILDAEERLVGFNPAAAQVLHLPGSAFGQPRMQALADWPELERAFVHPADVV